MVVRNGPIFSGNNESYYRCRTSNILYLVNIDDMVFLVVVPRFVVIQTTLIFGIDLDKRIGSKS